MKKVSLKIFLLSTAVLFVGCSDKSKKLNPQVRNQSVESLMGIVVSSNDKIYGTLNGARSTASYTNNNDVDIVSYRDDMGSNVMIDVASIQNSIEYGARNFMGVPYVWGATGPSKFDCSGFTRWVYRDVGIELPRVARQQATVGEYVPYENLQKGDMVFFDTHAKYTGAVTHVGIYLDNGNFIHASSTGKGVVIYNFDDTRDGFYKERFLQGRRVLQQTTHVAYLKSNRG